MKKKQQLLKCGARIYPKHVQIIRRAAKRLKISEADKPTSIPKHPYRKPNDTRDDEADPNCTKCGGRGWVHNGRTRFPLTDTCDCKIRRSNKKA